VARETGLRKAIRRIGSALDSYAAGRGWQTDEHDIYVRYREDLGRIGIVFVAEGFNGEDHYERFEDVMGFLENQLADDPELFRAINLVIWSRSEVESGSILTNPSGVDVPLNDFLIGGPAR